MKKIIISITVIVVFVIGVSMLFIFDTSVSPQPYTPIQSEESSANTATQPPVPLPSSDKSSSPATQDKFDENFQKKPAYFGVQEAFLEP